MFRLAPTQVVILAISAAVLAVTAIWALPQRQARRWAGHGIDGKDLAELENSARATLVQIIGGLALILTFAATWMQIADARKATDRTLRLSEARQQTERFTRAIDQLGSARMSSRLGGIFALDRVGRESPRDRHAILELMIGYLKERAPPNPGDRRLRLAGLPLVDCVEFRPAPDVTAAFNVLVGYVGYNTEERLDLAHVNLIGVRARGADLTRFDLTEAQLAGADLRDAVFKRARLRDTDLRNACLEGARFDRAFMWSAHLQEALLFGADLSTARIRREDARGAEIDDCTSLPWRRSIRRKCSASVD